MRSQPPPVIPVTVLETKLYVPRPRQGQVTRTRLSERLDRATEAKLVLVSAPAGFGKTTLLTGWLADPPPDGRPRSAAWLSLDAGDNDPAHFWTYVIAGLRTLAPSMGASALDLLQAPEALRLEAVLTTLINDLGTIEGDVVLVLDDYHVIESREVHDGMAFLLDHLPPQLHLVIAGRADPPLPLARLRAGGDLVEVRAADLRFTAEETAAYLNESMGLQLAEPDVATLTGRTEGWIAALQLAALSMQGRDDAGEFIAGFAGDDRYVVDYLVEEVVQRQPAAVQDFLLRTSVLRRMSGPLCDAVAEPAEGESGKAMLQTLERGNLFLVPLDDQRRWYRYHHLFADVLQARLLDEAPRLVPELHRRASEWYADHGEPVEAIRHALAGGDVDRAADLVELSLAVVRRDRQEPLLRGWLEALPPDVVRQRPVLCVAWAGSRLGTAEIDGVDVALRDAERWVDEMARTDDGRPAGMFAANEQELAWLPTWVAVYRAGLALASGDTEATVAHAQRALDLRDPDDLLALGAGTALIGLASWPQGDLETTHALYLECLDTFERAGHVADVLGIAITVGDIYATWGRLGDALRTYEEALQLAAMLDATPRGTADMFVAKSAVHHARGDLEAARLDLLRSQELGEHLGLPQNRYRWRVAMARLHEAEGDLDGALDLLDEADRFYVGDFSPRVRPVPALKARVLLKQGRLPEVREWARREGMSADDELTYLREFEHVTLARALLAEGRADEAAGLLERLLAAAEAGGRTGTVIEVLVLQALARQLLGDLPAALSAVDRALGLGEPEGHLRVFVDEGPPMAELLRAATADRPASAYVELLLAGLGGPARAERRPAGGGQLVEPLSEREHDVLRLLATDLSGPEIARRLVVSLNTVRTHTKNIYAKLGVSSRRAAVRRAEELGL